VPPELVDKIFDPYFTTKETSSGLGLAISYSIIRKHGGFLHLEGSSPAGATFAFYLPAARGKVMSDSLQPNDRSFHFNHQRILVMDDESAIRELTSQLLATMGYEVTAVPDGSEAVRIYERAVRKGEYFRAVILDATSGRLGRRRNVECLRSIDPGQCHHLQRIFRRSGARNSFPTDSAARCPSHSPDANLPLFCRRPSPAPKSTDRAIHRLASSSEPSRVRG
jgi:hypothetical protein